MCARERESARARARVCAFVCVRVLVRVLMYFLRASYTQQILHTHAQHTCARVCVCTLCV